MVVRFHPGLPNIFMNKDIFTMTYGEDVWKTLADRTIFMKTSNYNDDLAEQIRQLAEKLNSEIKKEEESMVWNYMRQGQTRINNTFPYGSTYSTYPGVSSTYVREDEVIEESPKPKKKINIRHRKMVFD